MSLSRSTIAFCLTLVFAGIANAKFFEENHANSAYVELRCQIIATHRQNWDAVLSHGRRAKASLQEYSVQRVKEDRANIQPIYETISHAVKFGEPDFVRGRLYEIAYQEIEKLIVEEQESGQGISRELAVATVSIMSLCDD